MLSSPRGTLGQFTIYLNRGQVKSRHRFSTAHEIAHLLVEPLIDHRSVHRRRYAPTQDDEGRRLEVLCNDMASAILMPRKRVEALLDRTGRTAACIPEMTRDFDVSFQAAARRYSGRVFALRSRSMAHAGWYPQRGQTNNQHFSQSRFTKVSGSESRISSVRRESEQRSSPEDVTIYPGPYRRLRRVDVHEAPSRDLCRGKYRRMYSFVYSE